MQLLMIFLILEMTINSNYFWIYSALFTLTHWVLSQLEVHNDPIFKNKETKKTWFTLYLPINVIFKSIYSPSL